MKRGGKERGHTDGLENTPSRFQPHTDRCRCFDQFETACFSRSVFTPIHQAGVINTRSVCVEGPFTSLMMGSALDTWR